LLRLLLLHLLHPLWQWLALLSHQLLIYWLLRLLLCLHLSAVLILSLLLQLGSHLYWNLLKLLLLLLY
jgi:hypothetical protein